MIVRDQSKRKNVANEVLKQAKRKGAKPGPARRQSSSSRSFRGTSRLLTGETVQSDAAQPPEEIVHSIYFWSNGFTVDDGPLRSFDDPEHASFLKSIKDSECPTELAPVDGRSKVNVNLVRKEERCPEPVKRPDPFQGGGSTVVAPSENSAPSDISSSATASSTSTATTKTKTATVATFHTHPDDVALAHHLRRWIQGEAIPWIHTANVYGDLTALTASYPPAIAVNGEIAWYFIGAPKKKEGSDKRMSRVAGVGTWKEERTKPLVEGGDGDHQQVGWRQSFTYLVKKRGQKGMPIGWIMLSIGLNDGEDAQGRWLSKVYPSPYQLKKKANPLVPLLPVLERAPLMDSAAATTAASVSATAITASTSAAAAIATATRASVAAAATTTRASAAAAATTTRASAAAAATTTIASAAAATTTASATPAAAITASATPAAATTTIALAAAATGRTTTATAATTTAAAAATGRTTTAMAAATTTTAAVTAAFPAAAFATPAGASASPQKKWIQVQISDSPTKSTHRRKRVYQMMEHVEQEGLGNLDTKRMRKMDLMGWLTIEPVNGSENEHVS